MLQQNTTKKKSYKQVVDNHNSKSGIPFTLYKETSYHQSKNHTKQNMEDTNSKTRRHGQRVKGGIITMPFIFGMFISCNLIFFIYYNKYAFLFQFIITFIFRSKRGWREVSRGWISNKHD